MIRIHIIVALALALAIVAGFAWHERDVAVRAQEAATTAKAQAGVNQAGAAVEARRATNNSRAAQSAQEATHDIDTAPDLDGALAAFGNGIDRVRQSGHAPVADGEPDRSGPDADR